MLPRTAVGQYQPLVTAAAASPPTRQPPETASRRNWRRTISTVIKIYIYFSFRQQLKEERWLYSQIFSRLSVLHWDCKTISALLLNYNNFGMHWPEREHLKIGSAVTRARLLWSVKLVAYFFILLYENTINAKKKPVKKFISTVMTTDARRCRRSRTRIRTVAPPLGHPIRTIAMEWQIRVSQLLLLSSLSHRKKCYYIYYYWRRTFFCGKRQRAENNSKNLSNIPLLLFLMHGCSIIVKRVDCA